MAKTFEDPKMNTTHTLEVTSAEVYVLQSALERLADVDDGAYATIADMASDLWGRLPKVDVSWEDITAED
jgi:hypothetical protein